MASKEYKKELNKSLPSPRS